MTFLKNDMTYSEEENSTCPICMERLELDDINFFPCSCGYQLCRFCWHRIKNDENGQCPACRTPYGELPASYKPLTNEQLLSLKADKRQKVSEKKQKLCDSRKHLANVRVVQKSLVFVVGLSQRLADSEVLKRPEYFGKFGKIHKVVVNQTATTNSQGAPTATAYITFYRSEDALRAVQQVNNFQLDGRSLKASLGTTKYCSQFLKGQTCNKADCMYLHEVGEEAASFTREEMQQGRHQEYEQMLHDDLFNKENGEHPEESLYKTAYTIRKDAIAAETKANRDKNIQNSAPTTVSSITTHQTHVSSNRTTPSPEDNWSNSESSDNAQKASSQISPPVRDHSQRNDLNTNSVTSEHSESAFINSLTEPLRNPSQSSMLGYFSTPSLTNHPDIHNPDPASNYFYQQSLYNPISDNNILNLQQFNRSSDWDSLIGVDKQESTDDELGFDPFDECKKGLAELMEKELKLSQASTSQYSNVRPMHQQPHGFTNSQIQNKQFPNHISHYYNNRGYSNFPSHQQSLPHPTAHPTQYNRLNGYNNFYGSQHMMNQPLENKEWQDGLRALLPNVNINFGNNHVSQSNNSFQNSSQWFPDQRQKEPNAMHSNQPISAGRRLYEDSHVKPQPQYYQNQSHWPSSHPGQHYQPNSAF